MNENEIWFLKSNPPAAAILPPPPLLYPSEGGSRGYERHR